MRRFTLLGVYLCLLPVVTLILIASLLLILHTQNSTAIASTDKSSFQALPEQFVSSSYAHGETEARVEVLQEFFKRYDSPLLAHAQEIVDKADEYSLDWRLIPAIAMQESTLCKKIPKNSFNCWGFGIYGGKIKRFDNFSKAIDAVTKSLAQEYKEKRGLEAPHEIVTRYTPGSTTWADKVSLVMNRIQDQL